MLWTPLIQISFLWTTLKIRDQMNTFNSVLWSWIIYCPCESRRRSGFSVCCRGPVGLQLHAESSPPGLWSPSPGSITPSQPGPPVSGGTDSPGEELSLKTLLHLRQHALPGWSPSWFGEQQRERPIRREGKHSWHVEAENTSFMWESWT